jgi:hypothetical protein
MLYAEICPKVRRHNARPEGECIMPSNLGTYLRNNSRMPGSMLISTLVGIIFVIILHHHKRGVKS